MADRGSDTDFKVTDRRRRYDEEPPAKAPAPPPQPTASERPQEAERSAIITGPDSESRASAPETEAGPGGRTLEGLFMMLATSAVVALGGAPDPMTGQAHLDPPLAEDTIDLLVLLREKTEGNRTAEETQMLDALIYDLQLQYVAVMKRSG